jgi:hypothetical protein
MNTLAQYHKPINRLSGDYVNTSRSYSWGLSQSEMSYEYGSDAERLLIHGDLKCSLTWKSYLWKIKKKIPLYSTTHWRNCKKKKTTMYKATHRPDDGGSKHHWNFGKRLPDYTAQQSRRHSSSYLPPWEPETSTALYSFSYVVSNCFKRPPSTWMHILTRFTRELATVRTTAALLTRLAASKIHWSSSPLESTLRPYIMFLMWPHTW